MMFKNLRQIETPNVMILRDFRGSALTRPKRNGFDLHRLVVGELAERWLTPAFCLMSRQSRFPCLWAERLANEDQEQREGDDTSVR